MADYQNCENEDFRVTVRPCGKRHWISWLPLLGPLVFKAPFFTGGHKTFDLRIKPKNMKYTGRKVILDGRWIGPVDEDNIIRTYRDVPVGVINKRKIINIKIETPWLGGTGHHRFDGAIRMDSDQRIERERGSVAPYQTWVNFDLKSSDTFVLWASAIIGSIIISALATIGGGLLVGILLKDDSPQPVVIVNSLPETSLEVQSETDSNEE